MNGYIKSFNTLEKLFTKAGEIEPYYAVLNAPQYISKNLTAENLEEFYQSGKASAKAAVDLLHSVGFSAFGNALDFGCGAGRVTLALGDYFDQVAGCDISSSMLKTAYKRVVETKKTNINLYKSHMDLLLLFRSGSFDFIYTYLVLQHMIPPLMQSYIKQFCHLLKPGGYALFQLPTHKEGYCFDDNMLDFSISYEAVQLHALSVKSVLNVINTNGCRLADFFPANCVAEGWESYAFLVRKDP